MIGAIPWEIQAIPGASETRQERAARDLIASTIRERLTTDRHMPGSRGISSLMSEAVSALWYGHAAFNLTAYDDGALEAYQIAQSSIQYIWTEPNGALRRVDQLTQSSWTQIPAERIAWVAYHADGGNWRGRGLARPLVFLAQTYSATLQSYARAAYMAAGVVTVTEPEAANRSVANQDAVAESLAAFESGALRTFQLPFGYVLSVDYPSGQQTAPTGIDDMLSAAVDQVLGSMVASLGYVSGSGSRALGEELADQDRERARQIVAWLSRSVGSWLIPWAARHAGVSPDVRLPVLGWRDDSATAPSATAALPIGSLQVASEIVRGVVSADPMVPPLAPAVAVEMLIAAGFSPEAADRMVAAQVASATPAASAPATPAPAVPMSEHPRGCGCCSTVRMSDDEDGEGVLVEGADGRIFRFYRPLTDLEQTVAWSDTEDELAGIFAGFAREVERIAGAHRAAVWQAIADRTDLDAVRVAYRAEYAAAIAEYVDAVSAATRTAAASEAERQISRGLATAGGGIEPNEIRAIVQTHTAQSELAQMQAAEAIASRVQGEVTAAAATGASPATWSSRQTPDGLAGEAQPAASQAEVAARIDETASVGAARGMPVGTIIRTSVRDRRRCEVCAARDMREWTMPADYDEFLVDPAAIVPDPECEGAPRCRCGLLVRLARGAA